MVAMEERGKNLSKRKQGVKQGRKKKTQRDKVLCGEQEGEEWRKIGPFAKEILFCIGQLDSIEKIGWLVTFLFQKLVNNEEQGINVQIGTKLIVLVIDEMVNFLYVQLQFNPLMNI